MTSALSLAGVTVMTGEVAVEGPAVTFWLAASTTICRAASSDVSTSVRWTWLTNASEGASTSRSSWPMWDS